MSFILKQKGKKIMEMRFIAKEEGEGTLNIIDGNGNGVCQLDVKKLREFLFKDSVLVTNQHAHSLIALVQYFKGMIEAGNLSDSPGRSDELTVGYCDELLEGLAKPLLGTRNEKGETFIHKVAAPTKKIKRSCKCREVIEDVPDDGWFSVEAKQCIHCHYETTIEEVVQ